jgi:hypothetical protein
MGKPEPMLLLKGGTPWAIGANCCAYISGVLDRFGAIDLLWGRSVSGGHGEESPLTFYCSCFPPLFSAESFDALLCLASSTDPASVSADLLFGHFSGTRSLLALRSNRRFLAMIISSEISNSLNASRSFGVSAFPTLNFSSSSSLSCWRVFLFILIKAKTLITNQQRSEIQF